VGTPPSALNRGCLVRFVVSELRQHVVSLILWLVSVAALVVLVLAFYPQVRNNASLNSVYADMSPAMQALLGGSDLTSPAGCLNTQLFAYALPAVLLVFGIGRGAAALAGEEEGRTLDLLLAQPRPRRSAYLQKAGALALSIISLTAAAWIAVAALDSPAHVNLPESRLLPCCLQLGLFALALSLVAQAVAAATGRCAVGLSVTAGNAVASHLVYGLSDTVGWLHGLRPLTLWRWYLANGPLTTGFGRSEVAVLAGVGALATACGVFAFERRDLHA
jgi:ABC-2 type transport system permease protein